MKRFFSFSALLVIGLIVFLPKSNLYYSAEEALSSTHLYLNGEEINDRLLYLDIRDASLLLDSMMIGSVEHIRFVPLIAFNRATITGVEFSGEFSSLFPEGIEHVSFTYTLLHPLTVAITGEGGFGPLQGEIDLTQNRLTLLFEPSAVMRSYPLLLSKLRKSDEGLVYETSF
ncbi:hypothetical protein [Sulfuricurvum sp.]|uniref:hypothetical protein n=1 Tax=Sulfuricurvum sp. TaxID=2025608 RepID=UPI003C52145F